VSDTPDLVAQLRRRLKDQRVSRTAFRISCTDTNATDCLLSITLGHHLVTQPINARDAKALDLDLHDPSYATIRLLVEYLRLQKGYVVEVDRDFVAEHPSADLELAGSASILGNAVPLRHHLFTEDELEETLALACARHNIGYTPTNVPEPEVVFVLTLAHALALRDLASDTAKRKEMDASSEQLLELARDLEESYTRDVRRQQRVLPVARPLDEADPGRGDVVVSSSYRRSLRTGYMSPISAALPPAAPVLSHPDEREVEDIKVTLQWTRNRDLGFYSMELWRDTRPNIRRPELVSTVDGVPSLQREYVKLPFTPKLCFRSAGPNSSWSHIGGIVALSEESGQTVIAFTDTGYKGDDPRALGPATAPPLEPATTYYYRLFAISLNNEVIASNEVVVTTKAMRALITKNGLAPVLGPSGTACTLTGSNFDAATRVTVSGKTVDNLLLVSPTQLTFNIPTFANPSAIGLQHDVVVTSGNGLIDVLGNGFKLTA